MKKKSILTLLISIGIICFTTITKAEYIFVSNENSDTVIVLDTKTKELVSTINTGGRPRDLKFNKDYTKLYVVVSEENHIIEIDTKTLKIIDEIETGDDPEIFDIDHNNKVIAVFELYLMIYSQRHQI